MATPQLLLPGSAIGILGGGQLCDMMIPAIRRLGYRPVIWCQSNNEPAAINADRVVIGPWQDKRLLSDFLAQVGRVTIESENIPVGLYAEIGSQKLVGPSPRILGIAQHRGKEKAWLQASDYPVAKFELIETEEDLKRIHAFPVPAILKTCQGGYDGRDQIRITSLDQLESAWKKLDCIPCVLEVLLDYQYEASVIGARGADGQIETFPMIENEHRDGILRMSHCNGTHWDLAVENESRRIVTQMLIDLDYIGVLTVEMFVMPEKRRIIVNEIAPRVHNSGHGTIEGCSVSQFEQHIRAVCGLPLIPVDLTMQWDMLNLIGVDVSKVRDELEADGWIVKDYGKIGVREGRKMGHAIRPMVKVPPFFPTE